MTDKLRSRKRPVPSPKTKEPKIDLEKPYALPAASSNPPKKIGLSLALRLRIRDGLSHSEIAKRFGCSREAVTQAFRRFTSLIDDPAQLEAYRQQKQGLFEASEQALLERICEDIQHGKASIGELARALDVVGKQVRLLKGQSTDNFSLVQTLQAVHADVDAALAEATGKPLPPDNESDNHNPTKEITSDSDN